MRFDHAKFYSGYRNAFTKLNQEQVDGLNFLLDAIENDPKWNSLSEVAYVLATIKHETADTFQPITERGGRAYFNKYEPPRAKARELGNVNEGDGYLYRGRGYVQITGRTNYRKFGIEDDPDKALEPETAYRIISEGMRKGSFTGKRLSNYIDSDSADYRQARRIVNGLDKAAHIAKLAEQFENILESSLVQVPATNTPEHATPPLPESKDNEGVTKTQDVAPSPIGEEKSGEPTPDTPAKPGQPIVGGRPEDPPKQASQGGLKSLWATISGAGVTTGMAVVAWFKDNSNAAVVLIICATVLILVFMFRQILMDWLRIKLASQPDRYNVQ